ncbi:MAG TPA: XRE family transcriptional regulator [Streptosporangiaceae bacterium]|jgi:DNA-binding XRE family transcriptional regulator/mannose-6-phosphate isomerase-like protein (cupin superfamily)|nr:XRE family transcriptional regulator [Streptosporangiaceae bacterium]
MSDEMGSANRPPIPDGDQPPGFDPGTGLGPRLRFARKQRNMSVRELASRVGCSASLLSQVERGLSVPSVGVLYSLATVLRWSLDHLLFGAGPGDQGAGPAGDLTDAQPGPGRTFGAGPVRVSCPPEAGRERPLPRTGDQAGGGGEPVFSQAGIVQRAATRRFIDMASGVRWERLTPSSDPRIDFLEVIYSPGGHSTDQRRAIRHEGYEYGLVTEGTLQANVGFETYELGPGDSIAFDSTTPHEYLNKTGGFVHAIWVVLHSGPHPV